MSENNREFEEDMDDALEPIDDVEAGEEDDTDKEPLTDYEIEASASARVDIDDNTSAWVRYRLGCHLTDMGNADRFAFMHHNDVKYCHQEGRWYIWDTTRFKPDHSNEIMRLARMTARCIDKEVAYVRNTNRTKELNEKEDVIKWAKSSESEYRLKAMLSLASSDRRIAVLAEDFDKDRNLLNCLNGTLDLETFELRKHRRKDLITKLAPVVCDLTAQSTLFDDFLKTVLPDEDVRNYLQEWAGYSLTGLCDEEKACFICGLASSGKSTFLEAMSGMMGDYAKTADFDSFVKQKGGTGRARNDIAMLIGRRFVTSIEVESGKALAEALFKTITGNERITARFLFKEYVDFWPQFKLFFAVNDMPRINAKDGAVWRRIDVIGFNVQIPEAERDPKVKRRLSDRELSGSAVLAWAVEGLKRWRARGRLDPPDVVRADTKKYRMETSVIYPFIQAECRVDTTAWDTLAALYDAYDDYCKKRKGMVPLDARQFGRELANLGFESARKRIEGSKEAVKIWKGLILLTDDDRERIAGFDQKYDDNDNDEDKEGLLNF